MAPASRPPGRPRALDDAKRREVCALISAGCGLATAARYVGCAASTIRREALRNAEFNEQLRRAALAAELMPLNALRHAAQNHWRAAAWLLERTNVQRFAKQNVRALTPEQLEEYNSTLASIIREETKDPETRRRIVRKVYKLGQYARRQAFAAQFDPFPKPRHKAKRRPGGPPEPPWKTQPPDQSNPQQSG